MATPANFQDILNRPSDQIEPPRPLPVGTYICTVDGIPEHKQMGKNNTDCFEFRLRPQQAGPDVDQEALLEVLKGKALSERAITHRLFVTEDSVWRLKKFITDLGIETGTRGLGAAIPEAAGKVVSVSLGHRPSDDGQQLYMEVKDTGKA